MIGHFLLSLTPEQEDLLLTKPFAPIMQPPLDGTIPSPNLHCMIMRVSHGHYTSELNWRGEVAEQRHMKLIRAGARHCRQGCRDFDAGYLYEYLCWRFGTERVNRAIRNRILTNKANRVAYAPQKEMVTA